MKQKLVYFIAGFLLLAVLYGVKEYSRTHPDLHGEPAVSTMDVRAITDAFTNDSITSNRLYVNKVIAVQGKITGIQNEDYPVVITLGKEGRLSSVQCSMDSAYTRTSNQVTIGKEVTIKGICTGAIRDDLFGTDVKLSRCILAKQD